MNYSCIKAFCNEHCSHRHLTLFLGRRGGQEDKPTRLKGNFLASLAVCIRFKMSSSIGNNGRSGKTQQKKRRQPHILHPIPILPIRISTWTSASAFVFRRIVSLHEEQGGRRWAKENSSAGGWQHAVYESFSRVVSTPHFLLGGGRGGEIYYNLFWYENDKCHRSCINFIACFTINKINIPEKVWMASGR